MGRRAASQVEHRARAARSAFFSGAVGDVQFLLAGCVGLRFAWHGLDVDAVHLTTLSGNVVAEGTLSPSAGGYPYGYAYPALNTFLAHLTGVPLETLQLVLQPFLVVLLVPVAYATYRTFIGSAPVRCWHPCFYSCHPNSFLKPLAAAMRR